MLYCVDIRKIYVSVTLFLVIPVIVFCPPPHRDINVTSGASHNISGLNNYYHKDPTRLPFSACFHSTTALWNINCCHCCTWCNSQDTIGKECTLCTCLLS